MQMGVFGINSYPNFILFYAVLKRAYGRTKTANNEKGNKNNSNQMWYFRHTENKRPKINGR